MAATVLDTIVEMDMALASGRRRIRLRHEMSDGSIVHSKFRVDEGEVIDVAGWSEAHEARLQADEDEVAIQASLSVERAVLDAAELDYEAALKAEREKTVVKAVI